MDQTGGAPFAQVPANFYVNQQVDPEAFAEVEVQSGFNKLLQYFRFERTTQTPCTDMEVFLEDLRPVLARVFHSAVSQHSIVRVSVCAHVEYEKVTKPDEPHVSGYLRTKLRVIFSDADVVHVVHSVIETIRSRHIHFMRDSSGLRLVDARRVDICIADYDPLKHVGYGYVELPDFLKKKHALINVKNTDNRCFGYALLSALHPAAKSENASRPHTYDRYWKDHPKLEQLTYPVLLEHLEAVEKLIEIPFNVYTFFDDEGKGRKPVYQSKLAPDRALDLLFWDGHFAWIKHFSRFLGDTNKNEHSRFYCKRCFGHFSEQRLLENHHQFCKSVDDYKQIFTMPEKGTKLSFYNVRYQQMLPFVVYADFESLTVPCEATKSAKKTQGIPIHTYQTHKPISVGLKLISLANGALDTIPYDTYTGVDAADWFLRRLLTYRNMCFEYLFNEERLVMTSADWEDFNKAKECYVCRKPFPVDDGTKATKKKALCKVRDHDHITGAYRGAAHSACNLKLRTIYKLPVFLHNFRNYDSHLIVPAFTAFKETKLQVIGQGLEKYLTLTWDDHIAFKDTLQFLGGSLEALVDCLLKSGRHNFKRLQEGFAATTDEEGITLLLRKGIYPYDYMSNEKRFEEDRLPPREAFHSRLVGRECSEEDYAHAQCVWQKFDCKTMLDYHNIYLKCDVLLLADVFESFRQTTMNSFGLDPAYYVSAPQLSWDCMMRMTGCELTLLNDPAMFALLNDNLRGGISVITKRYAKANNKYMGAAFNPDERSSYIFYMDANNLYGWAMSEPLPFDEFTWVSAEECEQIDWRAQLDDQPYGFFVECDFDYPDALHDAHNDYPLAPERLLVHDYLLSNTQHGIRERYAISHAVTAKLVPNFFPKKQQLVHYRNLRFYLEQGLVLTKVHKAIRFRQSAWLQPYVQTNTELRAKCKDPVEANVRKGAVNYIYGKCVENLTKRTDVKLVNSHQTCERLINKPHCLRFQLFAEELAAVELQKVKCLINKPTYVGFAVLELSKLHMYRFHYDHLRAWYPDAELLFTDTDSLVYQIYTDDLYADLVSRAEHFDFSNYSEKNPLFRTDNKMVLGKMKDESNGDIITEFVGLRPKMYSYTTMKRQFQDAANVPVQLKESKRAKGIQRAAALAITHADYLAQLRVPVENYVNIRRIGQKHHRIYSLESMKRGLCAFDDKRYLLPDGVHTLSHGHVRIRDEQQEPTVDDEIITASANSTFDFVDDYDGDLTSDHFVAMDAEQAARRNVRTQNLAEAIDAIGGVDLRQCIARACVRKGIPMITAPCDAREVPRKRARHAALNDCSDDEDDGDLTAIRMTAMTIAHNDAF